MKTERSEIKCEDKESCKDCAFIRAIDTELFNCGDEVACMNLNTIITAADEFLLECGGKRACMHSNPENAITIDCIGKDIKGIKCGDKESCRETTFFILGSDKGCSIEKIECDSEYACYGTTFEFLGYVHVEEFKCGDETSCKNLNCFDPMGQANCPGVGL
eukprot:CAMPEP_0197053742 /NCGR_PEP_ID=MMETSP1384-20130603/27922_1 /TAXON_ID=29189 /ORGANISM="Ammonia sp." /LENGTH=160 /DNA_ID=CAMNT_0042486683 /DNA_START=152 /DNA_END=634 /DNA_ORIENTATION=-